MRTEILDHTTVGAVKTILSGGVVAVPTETVYGLAADALDAAAVERVFKAKGRADSKPMSIFVTDMTMAEYFCKDIPESAYILAEKYWPGPLTMVLKRRDNVPDAVTAGGDTVGVRCPDCELTLTLIRETGVPLTGTSANLSGEPPETGARGVLRSFAGRIGCIIDGGEARGGVPSTVLDLTSTQPRILREGALPREEIARTLGTVVL